MYCTNYSVRNGDTLYSISRDFKTGVNEIMAVNPLINVYNLIVGETIYIPVSIPRNNYADYTAYLIEEGDTLGKVLDNYRINLADLMAFNKLDEIYLLPGTALMLPAADWSEGENTL